MNSDYPSLLEASMRMTLLVPHKFIYLRQEKKPIHPGHGRLENRQALHVIYRGAGRTLGLEESVPAFVAGSACQAPMTDLVSAASREVENRANEMKTIVSPKIE